MGWTKRGLIFNVDGSNENMFSHAAIPFADTLHGDTIRIYFSSRNSNGMSLPFSVDVLPDRIEKVVSINDKPLLNLGALGTFDECGIMPSCVVDYEGKKYLYYIAWNPQVTVSYRLSIGLAISDDGGRTFQKYSDGPICDRSVNEPYFNTAPFVRLENGVWRMWYISCTQWSIVNNYPEPKYHVKYCESSDGITWNKNGTICIDYDEEAEAIGRPSVLFEGGVYKMYYSYRKIEGYRVDRDSSYKLGYAESEDGIVWTKINNHELPKQSANLDEWDSEMVTYCHVFKAGGRKLMLYNGNGFGKSGFGLAEYV